MKKWLARWFGNGEDDSAPAPAPAPAAAIAAAAQATPDSAPAGSAPQADIDAAFYRWLTGAIDLPVPASAEKLILDELARLAATQGAGADLVPRVPAVIPQLLRSLRDESLSGTELSRQLSQDVVLVAEVIREANSPYYHPSIPVKSVETAVRLLGQNGLRMVIARVSFRPIISMQTGRFARQVAPQLWQQSEKCAHAARLLAPTLRANPFEAYLAGLMHNVGLIVAFRLIDQLYADAPLPHSTAFCAGLFAQARLLSARIGELWEFPVTVTAAIEQAGLPAAPATPPLAEAVALSDRLAKLRMLVDAGQVAADDPFVTDGLNQTALSCFERLHNEDD